MIKYRIRHLLRYSTNTKVAIVPETMAAGALAPKHRETAISEIRPRHATPVLDLEAQRVKSWIIEPPPPAKLTKTQLQMEEHNNHIKLLNSLPDDAFTLSDDPYPKSSRSVAGPKSGFDMALDVLERKNYEVNPEILRQMDIHLPKYDVLRVPIIVNQRWFQAGLYIYLGFVAAGVVLFGDWDALNEGQAHVFSLPQRYFWTTFHTIFSPSETEVESAVSSILADSVDDVARSDLQSETID